MKVFSLRRLLIAGLLFGGVPAGVAASKSAKTSKAVGSVVTHERPELLVDSTAISEGNSSVVTSYADVVEPQKFWTDVQALDWAQLMDIDFWRALRFTLTFTFITLF